jgi:CYTH domain-containing protein
VDVFQAALDGLVLVEYEGEDATGVVVPAWCGREVTQDDAFTGGSLAALLPDAA